MPARFDMFHSQSHSSARIEYSATNRGVASSNLAGTTIFQLMIKILGGMEESGRPRLPVTQETTGSNPVTPAAVLARRNPDQLREEAKEHRVKVPGAASDWKSKPIGDGTPLETERG